MASHCVFMELVVSNMQHLCVLYHCAQRKKTPHVFISISFWASQFLGHFSIHLDKEKQDTVSGCLSWCWWRLWAVGFFKGNNWSALWSPNWPWRGKPTFEEASPIAHSLSLTHTSHTPTHTHQMHPSAKQLVRPPLQQLFIILHKQPLVWALLC